jgi:tungstate transport system ATP-binding protein
MTELLQLKNVTVKVDKTIILDLPELTLNRGEVLVLLGPNGAGKSTLLQVAAGLRKPTTGTVLFPKYPHLSGLEYRRRISTVFQSPLLLTDNAENNVASGLRFRNLPRMEIKDRAARWMDLLKISHLAKRRANVLSGGEAQRVSLARAFCLETELILMDEPFAALDSPTRQDLLDDLRNIFTQTHQSCIYVTHDLEEPLAIGDRVGVFFNGQLHQLDSTQTVYSQPSTPEVAAFVGVENVIPGRVVGTNEELIHLKVNESILEATGNIPIGSNAYICLRPEDITLFNLDENNQQSSARNRLVCKITRLVNQGPLVRIYMDAGFPLTALVTKPSVSEMQLDPDKSVLAVFKASAIHIIPSIRPD